MMHKPLIIANWKMKLLPKEALSLARSIVPQLKTTAVGHSRYSFVVCPSFESLLSIGLLLKKKSIALGAQDCFWEEGGAYTGEVSPTALKQIGCSYVLIGHSERRLYCAESDEMIAKKLVCVSKIPDIEPVLCIGESLGTRKAGTYSTYIQKQLIADIARIPRTKQIRLTIAYEPLWAISTMGTGLPITPDHCAEVTRLVRSLLMRRLPNAHVRVIYGGSVDSKNILSFTKRDVSDGVLIGGASSTVRSFKKIVTTLNKP